MADSRSYFSGPPNGPRFIRNKSTRYSEFNFLRSKGDPWHPFKPRRPAKRENPSEEAACCSRNNRSSVNAPEVGRIQEVPAILRDVEGAMKGLAQPL